MTEQTDQRPLVERIDRKDWFGPNGELHPELEKLIGEVIEDNRQALDGLRDR